MKKKRMLIDTQKANVYGIFEIRKLKENSKGFNAKHLNLMGEGFSVFETIENNHCVTAYYRKLIESI